MLALHVIEYGTLARVLPAAMLGVYALGLGAYIAFAIARRGRHRAGTVAQAAACPRCGAPLSFRVGKAVERCAHCDASLVASDTVMEQALDAARADLRRAAMDRYRIERNAVAAVSRASASRWVPYYVLGSFLPMTAGSAVAFTVDMVTSPRSNTPLAGLAVLWMLAITNLGALASVAQLRTIRRNRWRAVANAVAARVGGRVSTSTAEWVGWLNAMWTGPYAVVNLLGGPYFHSVTGTVGAFAVAIDIDPVPADREHRSARADVLLAAPPPNDGEGVFAPADIAARIHALGFAPSACSAGLVATGTAPVLSSLKQRNPGPTVDRLLGAAYLLAEWAGRLGSVPVAPIR